MAFREHLERVVNEVPGCVSCVLLGLDGIEIESVFQPELAEELGAVEANVEYTTLLSQIRTTTADLDAGALAEVCLRSGKMSTVLRPVGEEYVVAAVIAVGGNVGRGRYALRLVAPRLEAELA